jgi:hypothetical protein
MTIRAIITGYFIVHQIYPIRELCRNGAIWNIFKENHEIDISTILQLLPKNVSSLAPAKLMELLKIPPKVEEVFLLDLLCNEISPRVGESV